MSGRKIRGVLTGILLVMALSLVLPTSSAAAGLGSASRDGDAWSASAALNALSGAWHWLSDLWAVQAPQAPDRALMKDTSTPPAVSGTPVVGCKDQGVCIDPNG